MYSRNKLTKMAYSIFLIGLTVFCWLVCTAAQVEKYLSMSRAAMVCAAGCCGVTLVLFCLRLLYKNGNDLGRWSIVIMFCMLATSFAVLYPRSQRHLPGMGSDREDALRVELYAVTHHQYPYAARTYLHNFPTPLPGAMWLAAPFYFAGKIALQNILWAGIFFWFLTKYFVRNATAVAFVFLFLFTALENLNDFDVGGDYVANVLYVSSAIFFFLRVADQQKITYRTFLAVMLLGLALSSRILYVVAIPPILAMAMQRVRLMRALLLVVAVLLFSVLVTLPVFTPDVVSNLKAQLNQNSDKLKVLPGLLSGMTLPLAALIVASMGFFLRMNIQRVFLLIGLATSVMILPPMLLFVWRDGGLTHHLTTDLEYLAVSSILISLWTLASWETINTGRSTFAGAEDSLPSQWPNSLVRP